MANIPWPFTHTNQETLEGARVQAEDAVIYAQMWAETKVRHLLMILLEVSLPEEVGQCMACNLLCTCKKGS